MSQDAVLAVTPLGSPPWATLDPFLFCVHHEDAYPAGNEELGPAAPLTGRAIGQDFEGKDGWRMYHGDVIPGFPQHPHRGFETVTIVRRGLIDHADSLGATARFGRGDVQWLTAGRGILHSEMFPLVDPAGPNPLELFQIWLNLPRADKMVEPYFTMFWREDVPIVEDNGARIMVVAGSLAGARPLAPPPSSWAARPESDLAIWTIALAPSTTWTLPPARAGTNRMLYVFDGDRLTVGGRTLASGTGARLRPDAPVSLSSGQRACELLLLQGRPIGEPVVQVGPFVMTSTEEIQQAFVDYRRTGFGRWPWPSHGPAHPRAAGRFARHADGRLDAPGTEPAAAAPSPPAVDR